MEVILCPRCGKKPLDMWYIKDKFSRQHLWVTCCEGKFAITLVKGLPLEFRETKYQKTQKLHEREDRLKKDQLPLF